jgi:7,8-dihydropterin-6-yl-methyl-4-(beta-D-ribofuranosyl)aminobenzene 5'-phosphate synthase
MNRGRQLASLRCRALLCSGGAVAFESLLASLRGGTKPARAEGLFSPVPEVDRIAIRVLIDSYQLAVAPDAKAQGVEINRFGWPIGQHRPGPTLISEFGFSGRMHRRPAGAVPL